MDSSLQETISDFDLNFLDPHNQQSVVPLSKTEKQRKAILCVKKKIIATTALIQKFYDKKELLELRERQLLTAKEECRQLSIQYKASEDMIIQLKHDNEAFKVSDNEWQMKYTALENQIEAMSSHCKQLQVLAKENETRIQSLMLESNLEKSETKDYARKVTAIEKDLAEHLQNISKLGELLMGKRKANKKERVIVEKYQKQGIIKKLETLTEDEDEDSDHGVFEEALSSPGLDCIPNENEKIQLTAEAVSSACKDSHDADRDSDSGAEVVSNYTGRESSLAFSGSDKFSSDYFNNDSPPNADKEKPTYVNIATSPITTCLTVNRSVSPIQFDEGPPHGLYLETRDSYSPPRQIARTATVATSPCKRHITHRSTSTSSMVSQESNRDRALTTQETQCSPVKQTDRAVATRETQCSPVKQTDRAVYTPETQFSPVKQTDRAVATRETQCSPVKQTDQAVSMQETQYLPETQNRELTTAGNNVSPVQELLQSIVSDVSCLEENTTADSEVANILSCMRLHTLITPIPTTPSKSRNAKNKCDSSALKQTNNQYPELSLEVAKLREEITEKDKVISALAKDVMRIKSVLGMQGKHIRSPYILQMEDNLPTKKDSLIQYDDVETRKWSTENEHLDSAMGLEIESDQVDNNNIITHVLTKENRLPAELDIQDNYESSKSGNVEINERRMSTSIAVENETSYDPYPGEPPLDEPNKERPVSVSGNSSAQKRLLRAQRLTKLEILRRKLLPKNKIKSMPAPKKLSSKSKPLKNIKKPLSITETASLNNQAAYEKAVKFMKEFRSKQNKSPVKRLRRIKTKRAISASYDKLETSEGLQVGSNLPGSGVQLSITVQNTPNKGGKANNITQTVVNVHAAGDECLLKANKAKEQCTPSIIDSLLDVDNVGETKTIAEESNFDNIDTPTKSTRNSPIIGRITRSLRERNKESVDDLISAKEDENISIDNDEIYHTPKKSQISRKRASAESLESIRRLRSSSSNVLPTSPVELKILEVKIERNIEIDNFIKLNNRRPVLTTNKETPKPPEVSKSNNLRPVLTASQVKSETPKPLEVTNSNNIRPVLTASKVKSETPKPLEVSKSYNLRPVLTTSKAKSDTTKPRDVSVKAALTTYDDLDIFTEVDDSVPKKKARLSDSETIEDPQDSVLCAMIVKYGVSKMKYRPPSKNDDAVVKTYHQKIEDTIAHIIKLPLEETKGAMFKFVTEIKSWNLEYFMKGLVKYLSDPERKDELFTKRYYMSSPALTISEEVLLFLTAQLKDFWPNVNFTNLLLDNIEYTLFRLNNTPDIGVVESMSHFYAVLCRHIKARTRLRMFIMSAMYCTQYKAIPLIKHCLDVWMHALPLAHMGIAKTPLVTCLVYLLHFFKCKDNGNRIGGLRHTLSKSYFYQMTEWNEPKILETFRGAIIDLRDIPYEKKMLRLSIILLAKRHGARWCDKNIVKGILKSIMDEANAPELAKLFCVSVLGVVIRPYPSHMKVNVEVVFNQLFDKLEHNPSPKMEEAIFTSLIDASNHNATRVVKTLLRWRPEQLSPEMEDLLRDFVRTKPVKEWQNWLSRISLVCS